MRDLFILLLALMVSQRTWGRLSVEIHFLRYMDDCEEDLGTSKCDPQFTFCLDRPDSSNSISKSQCTYKATGESSHYQNKDDLILETKTSIGGIPNPWRVEVDELLDPSVKLVVRVRDDDYFGDDHLETWNKVLTEKIYESRDEAVWANRVMKRNDHTMYFKIRIYCDTNYYSSNCKKFCKAEDLPTGHYTCEKGTGNKICMRGYTGPNCTEDIDECALNFCARGNCENLQGDHICHCPEHYTGKNCTNIVDPCDSQPCSNNGTCESVLDPYSYTCQCTGKWEGEHCELPLDPCHAKPCQNGGSCISNANNTAYTCDCTYLYLGIHCETRNENVTTTPSNASNGGGKTGQLQKEDDDEGFLLWHGILICILILIIVVVFIVCLVVRRRRRKEEKCPVGLPPGDTVVVFNSGDNLAFENNMYNDVNRNGGPRQTPLPATPTTPTDDELFNPVKPVFRPDDVEAQGAVGGGYHEMDADGYVKPSKFNCNTEGPEIGGSFQNERAQNNMYADFSAIHLKPLQQAPGGEFEDESHYQDLDEVASAVQHLDDAVNSDNGANIGPDNGSPSKRSKVPAVPDGFDMNFPPPPPSDDDFDDASLPRMMAPKPPQGIENPYTEPELPRQNGKQPPPMPLPKPKPSHYVDVPINTPRNSDPFSDSGFDHEEDPQHFGLPSVDDGGYATPKGSQRETVPLQTQESQYDSPRNSQSARSSANSEYDSPRSSPRHLPAPPPPTVAPKPPTRSISLKDQPDGYQNVEINGLDDQAEDRADNLPRPITIQEGYSFDNNDTELFETNVDDDDDEAKLNKAKSNPKEGLFMENLAFVSD